MLQLIKYETHVIATQHISDARCKEGSHPETFAMSAYSRFTSNCGLTEHDAGTAPSCHKPTLPTPIFPVAALSRYLRLLLNRDREGERKRRALAYNGIDPDFSPMHLDNPF